MLKQAAAQLHSSHAACKLQVFVHIRTGRGALRAAWVVCTRRELRREVGEGIGRRSRERRLLAQLLQLLGLKTLLARPRRAIGNSQLAAAASIVRVLTCE